MIHITGMEPRPILAQRITDYFKLLEERIKVLEEQLQAKNEEPKKVAKKAATAE